MSSATPIYVSRLVRLPLLDAEGVAIGRLDDVVLSPSGAGSAPRVLGFVAAVQRRRIFVNANRVGEIDAAGVRLSSGTVDLRRFALRSGELLADATSSIVRPVPTWSTTWPCTRAPGRFRAWEVAAVSIGPRGVFRRRRAGRIVSWVAVAAVFDFGPEAHQVAEYRELHPADMAQRIAKLPPERRRALAEAMDDQRLADLLEELPEDEQVRLIESLDVERAADVLEEMEADDAADLLAELPAGERDELLRAMEPEEAIPLRRLLEYEGDTAGGLMTPEPLVLGPDTTVAEALARLRDVDLAAALAAQVFVARPPTETPTGTYLGTVGFQRLLRERPASALGDCIDDRKESVPPDLPEAEVARRLAAYDAVAVAVCDEGGRLVGAVTIDDVLDRVLPEGWRDR